MCAAVIMCTQNRLHPNMWRTIIIWYSFTPGISVAAIVAAVVVVADIWKCVIWMMASSVYICNCSLEYAMQYKCKFFAIKNGRHVALIGLNKILYVNDLSSNTYGKDWLNGNMIMLWHAWTMHFHIGYKSFKPKAHIAYTWVPYVAIAHTWKQLPVAMPNSINFKWFLSQTSELSFLTYAVIVADVVASFSSFRCSHNSVVGSGITKCNEI